MRSALHEILVAFVRGGARFRKFLAKKPDAAATETAKESAGEAEMGGKGKGCERAVVGPCWVQRATKVSSIRQFKLFYAREPPVKTPSSNQLHHEEWMKEQIDTDPFSLLKEGEELKESEKRPMDICLPGVEGGGEPITVCRWYILHLLLESAKQVPIDYYHEELKVGCCSRLLSPPLSASTLSLDPTSICVM